MNASLRTIVPFALACGFLGSFPAAARADGGAPNRQSTEPHQNWLAPPDPLWPLVPIAVLVGAGLVVSTVYALKVSSDQNPVDSLNFQLLTKYGGSSVCDQPSSPAADTCSRLKSSQDVVNADNTLMIVGGVVAGTAAVGGVLYYLLGPGKADQSEPKLGSRLRLVPWLGGGSSGVSLSGRF
jgi:hypothetical protein